VNERLAATGEFWQLDAKTRVTLVSQEMQIPSQRRKVSSRALKIEGLLCE
jgi:hypothetical protein